MSNLRTLFGLCLLSALLVLRLSSANVVTTGVNATLLAEPNDEIPCDVTLAECRAWCHSDIRLPSTNCGTDNYCCVLTD